MNLPYKHDISGCLKEKAGSAALSPDELDSAIKQAEKALLSLREQYNSHSLALLDMPSYVDDLAFIKQTAERIKEKELFVLGTGGSSLGAQAVAQLTGWNTQGYAGKKVYFFDNLDPLTMEEALANCDISKAHFLVVSKSGNTVETMMQTLRVFDEFHRKGVKDISNRVTILTEPEQTHKLNPLRDLGKKYNCSILNHHIGIGGRYAVLTNVGVLPAFIMGLDGAGIRKGAGVVLEHVINVRAQQNVVLMGAAIAFAFAQKININVFFAYADRLKAFLAWHCQLWSESLGKSGFGTTPLQALGPLDQHSQLQLYLDGPCDKMFTIFMLERDKYHGIKISDRFSDIGGMNILLDHSMDELVDAEQKATADTLINNGRPVRKFVIQHLDEFTIGALFMHFMLETILTGYMAGIDPFTQPAVEEGKILAKKYLNK